MGGSGNLGGRDFPVQDDGLLERIQICPAVRTGIDMFLDLPAPGRGEVLVEVVTDVLVNLSARFHGHVPGAAIYGWSWSRRKALARRNRDFAASSVISRMDAVS